MVEPIKQRHTKAEKTTMTTKKIIMGQGRVWYRKLCNQVGTDAGLSQLDGKLMLPIPQGFFYKNNDFFHSLTHLLVIHGCLFALNIQRGFYIPLECYCCVIGGNLTPN